MLRSIAIVSLFITVIIFYSCKKPSSSIPDTPVDFTIYLNDPLYRELRVVGNSITVTGGHAGIIIYRLTESDFVAYDRLCPFEQKNTCRLNATGDDLEYRCSCCNTPYLMIDGSGQSKADSTFSGSEMLLKAYNTNFDGVNAIRITNF